MKKILYVEDNRDIARAVQLILTNEGHNVDLAFNGKACFELLSKNNYHLVLLDVMLPDISGFDIFNQIKHQKERKYAFLSIVPISHDEKEVLLKEGVVDYINKPFDRKDLTMLLDKAFL